MRYRQLDANGDYTLGQPFLVNSPSAVGQAALTRMKLWQDEWFLDLVDGTPWKQSILGKQNGSDPDAYVKQRILGTTGVTAILSYNSVYNGNPRSLSVKSTLNTLYGQITISTTLTPAG